MSKRRKILVAVGVVLVLVPTIPVIVSDELEFTLGGALIDLGYRFQDPIEPEHITPDDVWEEVQAHNALASDVRERFPRSVHHPVAALLVCMDARIDTNELVGDTRRYYYIVRTAGSVMGEREEEMLELAVVSGVKLIVLTTHTDCAAERVAASSEMRERFPHLAAGVDERQGRVDEFLARPLIAERMRTGQLIVRHARIDTATGRMLPPHDHVAAR